MGNEQRFIKIRIRQVKIKFNEKKELNFLQDINISKSASKNLINSYVWNAQTIARSLDY